MSSDALQKELDACSTDEDRTDLRLAYTQIVVARLSLPDPLAENVLVDTAKTIAAWNKQSRELHRWAEDILLANCRKETGVG